MRKAQTMVDDREARERIRNELSTSFLVEAGAGSGKTTSLVERMLNLIATGSARMGELAAITFTNKAASELLGRFRMKLEACWREASADGPEKERYAAALQELGQCFIGTIHSFCGQLLRERPIEAGVDPSFRELDEAETAELCDRAWDEYVERVEAADGEANRLLQELAELGIDVAQLRGMYRRMTAFEDVTAAAHDSERPDLDRIRLSLFPLVEEACRYMPTAAPVQGWDTLQEACRKTRRMMHTIDMGLDRNVVTAALLFDKTISVTLNRWTDKAAAKELKERFAEWQLMVLAPVLQQWREYVHPKIIRFVVPAAAYFRNMRTEAGLLSFQDLLLRTAELLRSHSEVRAYFARRYTRLFVDEFQDTDPVQAEMLLLLTGRDTEESDWRRQLPRPGSFFVVGDPKQSIYRFRRADISTYNFVKERIRQCGDVLELNRNFRSVHAIGDYVNYAFESRFVPKGGGAGSELQAEFVRMETVTANPKKTMFGVGVLSYEKVEYDRKAAIAELDSERIARWILSACRGGLTIQERSDGKLVTRPAVPSDFLILLKRREFIGLYAEKLERIGVPADTSGSAVVYEEIRALRQLVLCLLDPADKLSLLAVLRGKLFGLSDDALYAFRMEGGGYSWYQLPSEEQLSVKARPVRAALARLSVYASWVRELSALAALIRIVDDLGVLPYAAVLPSGAIRLGTLARLLQLVQADREAAASWHGLAAYMERILGTESMEGTSWFAGTGSAVRIMNVHKAKGLEAPVVFLACPCGAFDPDVTEHIDRFADPPRGYFTLMRLKTPFESEVAAQPTGWPQLAEKERGYMRAEEDRLLYVAATRAKQLLVVSRYPARPAIDPWSGLEETLQGQPELDDVAVEAAAREPLQEVPDSSEAEAAQQWRLSAAKPTFRRASVTELAKGAGERPERFSGSGATGGSRSSGAGTGSGGMMYGTVVHRCLEMLGTDAAASEHDLIAYVRLAAQEEGLDEKWLAEAEATVRAVTSHALWQRALLAKRRCHEFPFVVAEGDMIVSGVIDLLFEEEDGGWVIVDFKTDTFELEQLQSFTAYYKPQVASYAERLRGFGYNVKEAGLWFLKHQEYVKL